MQNKGQGPGKIKGHSIDFYNECLYVFGIPENDENDLFKFDLNTHIWSKINSDDYNPEGRLNHKSAIFNNQIFIFFGINSTNHAQSSALIYNFNTNSWKKINLSEDMYLYGSSSILINNFLYFFLGIPKNSVKFVNLESNSLEILTVSSPTKFPYARKNHLSYLLENEIYIFGGVTYTNIYLNDIWKFNIDKLEWIEIIPSGNIPEARELMSSFSFLGLGFLMFGGRNDANVFSDLLFYSTLLNSWVNYTPSSLSSESRYGSCMASIDTRIFIIGGENNSKILK